MSTCRSVSSSSPAPFRSGIGGVSTGLASRSSLQLAPPWGFGPKTISAFLATPLDPGQIRPEFAAIRRDAWPCLDRGKTIQTACEACASSTLHAAHLFTLPAPSVASLYPLRWQGERFFQGRGQPPHGERPRGGAVRGCSLKRKGRCQKLVEPRSRAALSPAWSSLTTSFTPFSPRPARSSRNGLQWTSASLSRALTPKTSR